MSKLFYTYHSGGDSEVTAEISSAYSYSIIFDTDRNSIWVNGNEYGHTSGLPDVSASDNGKILRVVNGAWQLVTPTALYSGTGTPSDSQGNNGDIYIQV